MRVEKSEREGAGVAPAEVTIIRMGDEGEAEEAGETNSQSPVFLSSPHAASCSVVAVYLSVGAAPSHIYSWGGNCGGGGGFCLVLPVMAN